MGNSAMIQFRNTLKAFGSPEFNGVLKNEIEHLDAEHLPLQQGLTTGSYALNNKIQAMILDTSDDTDFINARVGIFYTSIIAGCNCADDPTPVDENNEYCEVQFAINKITAETTVKII
jgi:hypothetical protein